MSHNNTPHRKSLMGGCVVRISSILTIELEDASQRIPVLTQKREREKVEREKKRAEKQDGTAMDVDGGTGVEEEIPTCTFSPSCSVCNC
jgi:uncharacterized small protein (DUF1192 family)